MALACRCDRCGNFFLPGANGRVKELKTANISMVSSCFGPLDIKSYHLCNTCYIDFETWIRGCDYVKEELKDENEEMD